MSDDWQIDAIADASERISSLVREGDLAEPVPHLGRWKTRDVVAHLGGVHRWATRVVTDRSIAGPGFKKSKLDGIALCDWFDAGAQGLLDVLRSTPFSETCPNFNPGSGQTVAWWARRQAHESIVHRWDIERNQNETTKIAPLVAADGIDEFLDVFVRTRGKQTLASTLVLSTRRPKRAWTLIPAEKPGRIDVADGHLDRQDASGVAAITGTPEGLLLALWGRLSATEARLAITGETSTAESLIQI